MKDQTSQNEQIWTKQFQSSLSKPFYSGVSIVVSSMGRNPEEKQNFFWNKWILSVFNLGCLSTNQKFAVCYSYFSGKHVSTAFVKHLLENEPQLFLDAIRLAKIPYSEKHWQSIKALEDQLSPEFSNYLNFMTQLKELDERLFHQTLLAQSELSPERFGEHLAIAAAWIEDRSHQLIATEDGHLIAVIGFFTESQLKVNAVNVSNRVNEFQVQVLETTKNEFDTSDRDAVLKVLDYWLKWHMFKITLWDTFFYDLNFKLAETEQILYPERVEEYLNWKEKGDKYWGLNEYYMNISSEYAGGVAERIGKSGLPKDEMAAQIAAMHLYAADLHVHYLNKPSILDLIWAVARERFLNGAHIARIASEITLSGDTTRVHKRLINIDERVVPIKILSKDQALDWTAQFLPDDCSEPRLTSEQVLKMMSTEFRSSSVFNRHKPELDLHAFPYILVDEVYFLFPSVAGRQIAVHSISEMTLGKGFGSDGLGKASSSDMENHLAEMFGSLNSRKPLFGNEFWPENDREKHGDVDFAWLHENNFYVFQLKRGLLRLNLAQTLKERLGSLMKAAEQIKLASENLHSFDNEISKYLGRELRELRVIPVVIHTSFEASYEMVDGIPVLNYFDVLQMLENKLTTAEVMNEWLQEKTSKPWLVSAEDLKDYPPEKLKVCVGLPKG